MMKEPKQKATTVEFQARLAAVLAERQQGGMAMPHCPGCRRTIRAAGEVGAYGVFIDNNPGNGYLVCAACAPRLGNPHTHERFTARIERRLEREPLRYYCTLHLDAFLEQYAPGANCPGHRAMVSSPNAASEADRQWFETHPGRTTRIRERLPGEILRGKAGPPCRVVVRQVSPGWRSRMPLPERWSRLEDSEENASRVFDILHAEQTGRSIGERYHSGLSTKH